MMNQCIIYKLINTINGMIYIGQTWKSLIDRIDNGRGYANCARLHNAINKYGVQNFKYEVLTVCGTQYTADYWEIYFIDKYDSRNLKIGYNLKTGGSAGKHSLETKEKMAKSHIGINTWMKGKKFSLETRIKLSNSLMGKNVGKKASIETRQKLSAAKLGNPSPFKGKTQSEESRARMSKSRIGNTNRKGKKASFETRAKMSKSSKSGKTWKIVDGKRVWMEKE